MDSRSADSMKRSDFPQGLAAFQQGRLDYILVDTLGPACVLPRSLSFGDPFHLTLLA
ncbi:hypothetical protein D3C72_2165890 [compost metagenome]